MNTKTRVFTYLPLTSDVNESELLISRGSAVELHELAEGVAGDSNTLHSLRVAQRTIIDRGDYSPYTGVMNATVYLDSRGLGEGGSIVTPYAGAVGGSVTRLKEGSGETVTSGWTDETAGFEYTPTSEAMVSCGGGRTYYLKDGSLYRWHHSQMILTLLSPMTGAESGSGTAVFNFVCCSADGSTVIVGAQDGHYPSVSFDFGETWEAQTSLSPYDALYTGVIASGSPVLWIATQSAIYRRYHNQSTWALMYALPDTQLEWAQGCSTVDGLTSMWVARARSASANELVGMKPISITDTGVLTVLNNHKETSYYGVVFEPYEVDGGTLITMEYTGLIASYTINSGDYNEQGTVPNVRRVRQAMAYDDWNWQVWVLGYYAAAIKLPISGVFELTQHAKEPGYRADWQAIASEPNSSYSFDGETWCVSDTEIWRFIKPEEDNGGGGNEPT